MSQQIIELYSETERVRLKQNIKRWRTALCILAFCALVAILRLIALTDTGNAVLMERAVIAVSTVTGWIVIYFSIFVVTAGQRELSHANMLQSEERQTVRGNVKVTNERVAITRSITARRVEVHDKEEIHLLLVCESKADTLAAVGEAVLYFAHGYVAAYEVML